MTFSDTITGLMASVAELELILSDTSEDDEDLWLEIATKLDNAQLDLDIALTT